VVVVVPGSRPCVVEVVDSVVVPKPLVVLVLLRIGGVVLDVGDGFDELGENVTIPEVVVVGTTTEVVLNPLVVPGDVV
jgi:hypothetical protein